MDDAEKNPNMEIVGELQKMQFDECGDFIILNGTRPIKFF